MFRFSGAIAVLGLVLSSSLAYGDEQGDERYSSAVYARLERKDESEIVITGAELRERGAQNLAQAVDLIPGVIVRPGGMGDTRADLPGVRQTSVLVLIDGIPVAEPYMGVFDLASIPTTDIVTLRVSFAPASPLDGPGGDGGVIEVETLRARGKRRLRMHLAAGTDPGALAATTDRAPLLGDTLALRASAGAGWSAPVLPAVALDGRAVELASAQSQGMVGLRFDLTQPFGVMTADAFYQHRTYISLPADEPGATVLAVPSEDTVRLITGMDARARGFRIAAGLYAEAIVRETNYFDDATLSHQTSQQELHSSREGGALSVDRPLGEFLHLSTRLSIDSEGATVETPGLPVASGRHSYLEAAVGGQIHWRWLRVDGAVGIAALLASAPSWWPEGKLTLTLTPTRFFSVLLAVARKGRTPTLRELYDPSEGNPKLAPELSTWVEARVISHPVKWLRAHVAASYRIAEGLIRLNSTETQFVNLDEITIRGIEAAVEVAPVRAIGAGVSYFYGDADSVTLGPNPLFNFPAHRLEARITATFRQHGGALLRVRYVSDRIDMNTLLAPYTVVDLSGWVRLSDRLTATLRVANVLDAHYQARAFLAAPPPGAFLSLNGDWQ